MKWNKIINNRVCFTLFCLGIILLYTIADEFLFRYFAFDSNYTLYSMVLSFVTFLPFAFGVFLRTKKTFWNKLAILSVIPWLNILIAILTLFKK